MKMAVCRFLFHKIYKGNVTFTNQFFLVVRKSLFNNETFKLLSKEDVELIPSILILFTKEFSDSFEKLTIINREPLPASGPLCSCLVFIAKRSDIRLTKKTNKTFGIIDRPVNPSESSMFVAWPQVRQLSRTRSSFFGGS